MDFLTQHDSTYLLNASLGSLHEESNSWLEEINFWQSETAFFFKLLNKRMPMKDFPSEKLSLLERGLVDIQTLWLDKSKKEVLNHERTLAALLQNQFSSDEEEFRMEHQRLREMIYNVQDMIKRFKNDVFALF